MTSNIPEDERRVLDTVQTTREGIYRAWLYGRIYERHKAIEAILSQPSVFDVPDEKPIVADGTQLNVVAERDAT